MLRTWRATLLAERKVAPCPPVPAAHGSECAVGRTALKSLVLPTEESRLGGAPVDFLSSSSHSRAVGIFIRDDVYTTSADSLT